MTRRLMITVDVEAQPGRAERDHLDRLVWGRFPEGQAGIGEMMDIADRHGVRLTMFLDYCEEHLYGEALLDVGREIARRGHDLELHAHPDFLRPEFWSTRGLAAGTNLSTIGPEQAEALAAFLCERHEAVCGRKALAFRGGGYRYSPALLDALVRRGVALDLSVNITRATQPFALPPGKQFAWANGCLEVPVSCVLRFRNKTEPLDFNFSSAHFRQDSRFLEFLDKFHEERGEDAVAVLVLHSWSFLELTDKKHFTAPLPPRMERFDRFLGLLADKTRIVTARDLVADHAAGLLPLDPPVDIFGLGGSARAAAAGATNKNKATVMHYVHPKAECPICGAEKERFVDMGGRRCPDCGSVERQRSLAVAYDQAIRRDFDVAGRRVFIISPSACELRFLGERGITGKTCVDVRPEFFSPKDEDVLIADVCAMPQVATGSQEFVFASYLMPGVHDMDKALDEFARILAPAGAFFSIETLHSELEIKAVTDPEAVTSFYGKQTLEKYGVGNFRVLGAEGYLRALSARFSVQRYSGVDPITGMANLVHVCRHKGAAKTEDSMQDDEKFQKADEAFARYLAENPGGSYAQFSVGNQLNAVQSGVLHPTLGKKLRKFDDYWEAGRKDFATLQKLLGVRPRQKLVDYGCGSLRVGKFFIEHLNPGGYFGLDVLTGFIEMGKEELGEAFLKRKQPRFGAIEEKALAEAEAFGADVVLSTACAFQIHPDEKTNFINDVKRLASKGDSIVCFDTKIGPRPMRFKASSWVWTLDYYKKAMAPMELLASHKISDHTFGGQDFEGQILIFGHPGSRRVLDKADGPAERASAAQNMPKPSLAALRAAASGKSFANLVQEVVRPATDGVGRALDLLPHAPLGDAYLKSVEGFTRMLPPTIGSWMDLARSDMVVRAADLAGSGPESADLFISTNVLDFLEDHEAVIAAAARVLRPGGMALFQIKHARLEGGGSRPRVDYRIDPLTVGLPAGADLPSTKVGRRWFLEALGKAGLEAGHFEHRCEDCQETFDWLIGRKPGTLAASTGAPAAAVAPAAPVVAPEALPGQPSATACSICGEDLTATLAEGNTNCPKCRSAVRTRTLTQLAERLSGLLKPLGPKEGRTLLAFAMTGAEAKVQTTLFGQIRSASLYGTYHKNHETGVDARDLSRYPDASFDGVSGILLFDYFEEHGQALREIARVLRPGGVFYTHIAPYRLATDPSAPPKSTSIIKKRKGYFEYVPDNADMPSVNVGSDWLLAEMRRAGLEPCCLDYEDGPSGETMRWFLGVKQGGEVLAGAAGPAAEAVPQAGEPRAEGESGALSVPETHAPCPAWLESVNVRHQYFAFPSGKLYYYRNVRTGLSSVLQAIDALAVEEGLYPEPHAKSLTPVRTRFRVYEKNIPPDGLTFTIVRNPFRRLATIFAYGIGTGRFFTPGSDEYPRYQRFGFNEKTDFADFVRAVVTIPPEVSDDFITPQSHRLFHDKGKRVKFIARLESIAEDWPTLMRHYGADMPMPHRNRTLRSAAYWTEELRRLVYDYYYDDFRIFGYDPRSVDTIEVRPEPAVEVRVADTHFEDSFAQACARAFAADNEAVRRVVRPEKAAAVEPSVVGAPASRDAADVQPQAKDYSIPVPKETGFSRVVLRLSLPPVPKEMDEMCFAEHVLDPVTGESTGQVILCGDGALGVTDDLGETWRTVRCEALRGHRLWNCFTRADGGHIVQTPGWQGPNDPETDPEKHAAIFVFDRDWNLEGRAHPGSAAWLGSASIGQSGETIIFAEYHNNIERYAADFEARREEILPLLRSNAVLRSRDGGLTWEKVFERGPLEIRHFHTVQPDPFVPRRWWLSSGDKPEEAFVWRSDDDGDTWLDVTNPEPDVTVSPTRANTRRACQRFADMVIGEDDILWGADDLLGHRGETNFDPGQGQPGGARMYLSPKGDMLQPRELGYIGHPVRSIIDVGPAWIILTEAKQIRVGLRPTVFLLFKDSLRLIRLLDVDNYRHRHTGFSYSRSSRKAKDGTFFCFRGNFDAVRGGVRVLKWRIEFE